MSTPGIGADQRGDGGDGSSATTLRRIGDGFANVAVKEPGRFFALCLDTGRAMFKWPFQWREFIQQAWFIVSVTVHSHDAGRHPVRRDPVAPGRRR